MGTQVSKKRHVITHLSEPATAKYGLTNFAVITVIFNPMRYKTRYDLYRKFSRHMSQSGVILVTVECIFEGENDSCLPKQKFEVTQANNPQHLQISAPSVVWLKENLINMAVQRLPLDIEYIAWLDADIEFERLDWPQLTIAKLQKCSIVQLFQSSYHLGPKGKKQILKRDYSFVYAMQHGILTDVKHGPDRHVHPGYAWAMRRHTFDQIGGLLDFSIVGGADVHFAYALFNRVDETIPENVHPDYRYLTKLWGQRVAFAAGHGYKVGYIVTNVWHYWHGDWINRAYQERWSLLEQYQYSPLTDLEKNDLTGLIRLNKNRNLKNADSHERLKVLQQRIIRYFQSRQEDKTDNPLPIVNTSIESSRRIISSKDAFRPTDDLQFQYHTSSVETIHPSFQKQSTKKASVV